MQVADDMVVAFHFTLTTDGGELIHSTRPDAPLTYLHGRGELIEGLENAMLGRSEGATFDLTLEPSQAYGQRDPQLVQTVDRAEFPGGEELEVGMKFRVEDDLGQRTITIAEIDGDQVKVDGNHPLAGETISFEVEILEIREASQEELSHGHAHPPGGHGH